MKSKYVVSLIAAGFVIGLLLGAAGGGSFVLWKSMRFEANTFAMVQASSTFKLVPLIIALGTEDEEERLDRFESAARTQMSGGVITMHANLLLLSDENRVTVQGILASIARNREKLGLGQFDSPRQDHIEEILVSYQE